MNNEGRLQNFKLWVNSHVYICIVTYLVAHTSLFFLISNFVEPKYYMHTAFDDMVPLCEYLIVPYVSWFFAFAGSLVFMVRNDRCNFWRMFLAQVLGSTICCVVYVFFQNAITMPQQTVNHNIFSLILELVWASDNTTNACPSLHVLSSTVIAVVTWYSNYFKNKPIFKIAIILWMIIICTSTMFVKQHSIIDVICGAILGIILALVAKKLI